LNPLSEDRRASRTVAGDDVVAAGQSVITDAPALMLRPERVLLHALVRALRPVRVLEIGTHQGGSTLIMCAALDEVGAGRIVCVEPNPAFEPGTWAAVAHRASLIEGVSPDALGEAAEAARGPFDFVFVDGDHTTEGVRRDIEGVLPLLSIGSYVVFHDAHYWQVAAAIEQSLADSAGTLVDCGMLSTEDVREERAESGHPVAWGGLRMLRYLGPTAVHSAEITTSAQPVAIHDYDGRHPIRRARRALTAPLKRYLDTWFQHLDRRLDEIAGWGADASSAALARVDVSPHNDGRRPPSFESIVSQVVSESQFAHPDFLRLRGVMFPRVGAIPCGSVTVPSTSTHRKLWEWCYILRAAEQHGKLVAGGSALGFGVGSEPLPAALASFGLSVIATDRAPEASAGWASAGQHMDSLRTLSKPDVVPDDVLAQRVTARHVDMNDVPDDLGTFDVVWSSCALEHLGSPEAGLAFIMRTLELLGPGGISVHTTELELTRRATTADHGHLAVYRVDDLDRLVEQVKQSGFEMHANWYVSMDSPIDRFVAVPPYVTAHLKLAIGDSVSTSVGLLIRRPG
jgi:predicted O-methyltransferase YrrM